MIQRNEIVDGLSLTPLLLLLVSRHAERPSTRNGQDPPL